MLDHSIKYQLIFAVISCLFSGLLILAYLFLIYRRRRLCLSLCLRVFKIFYLKLWLLRANIKKNYLWFYTLTLDRLNLTLIFKFIIPQTRKHYLSTYLNGFPLTNVFDPDILFLGPSIIISFIANVTLDQQSRLEINSRSYRYRRPS